MVLTSQKYRDSEQTKNSGFTCAFCSLPDALKQLIAVYIGRCSACWKEPEVMVWLEKNVKEVIKRVNNKDPVVKEYAEK